MPDVPALPFEVSIKYLIGYEQGQRKKDNPER